MSERYEKFKRRYGGRDKPDHHFLFPELNYHIGCIMLEVTSGKSRTGDHEIASFILDNYEVIKRDREDEQEIELRTKRKVRGVDFHDLYSRILKLEKHVYDTSEQKKIEGESN